MLEELTKKVAEVKTRWFHTHPCDRDRVAAVRQAGGKGIFVAEEMPASVLFADFKELCRMGTIKFYQDVLGKHLRVEHLHTTEKMVDQRESRVQNFTALQRYFQGLVSPLRPLKIFGAGDVPQDLDERALVMMQARTNLCEVATDAAADAKAFNDADVVLQRVMAVRILQSAQIKFQPKDYNFVSADVSELRETEQQAMQVRQYALETLNELLIPQGRRLRAALEAVEGPKPAAVEETYDVSDAPAKSSSDALLEALRGIELCHGGVDSLRTQWRHLNTLLAMAHKSGKIQLLASDVISVSALVYHELNALHHGLRKVRYPYEHMERGATISRFCCRQFPTKKNIARIHAAAKGTLEGIDGLYMRLMSDVAQQAEQAESDLGLPPLPDPKL